MTSPQSAPAHTSWTAFLKDPSFLKRSITSIVLIPLVLWILLFQPTWVKFLSILILGILGDEWRRLLKKVKPLSQKLLWHLGGFIYFVIALWGFYTLYEGHTGLALTTLCVIWATDTAAYLVGRLVGKRKLAPRISPNKTWEGALGGFGGGLLVGIIAEKTLGPGTLMLSSLLFWGTVSIVGQIGDLLESALKRHFNVKESGFILPGHGGMFDRLDSFLLVGFCFGIWVLIFPFI